VIDVSGSGLWYFIWRGFGHVVKCGWEAPLATGRVSTWRHERVDVDDADTQV
jgi:hypothetical protein